MPRFSHPLAFKMSKRVPPCPHCGKYLINHDIELCHWQTRWMQLEKIHGAEKFRSILDAEFNINRKS